MSESPPTDRSRPLDKGGNGETTGQQVSTTVPRRTDSDVRDTLVQRIAALPAEQVPAAGLGWHLGVIDGTAEGIAAEEWATAARWHAVYVSTKQVLDLPTQTATTRRRELHYEPCPRSCRQCSRCIAYEAWYRRGRRPFEGVERERQLAAGAR